MPRNLSPAVTGAIADPQKSLAWFLEIVFPNTETIFAWSGLGPQTPAGPAWDPGSTFPYGTRFTGVGWLGKISTLPQTAEVTAENMRLTLSGIPTNVLNDAINGVRLSGSATLWLAFLDTNNNVIPDPLQMWQGQTDVPTLNEGADTVTLDMTVENALIALNLASNRRYTTLDQQLDYPGDAGFDFVTALQGLYLPFPDGTQSSANIPDVLHLIDAPNFCNGLTISPSGAQKLNVTYSVQMTAYAQFSAGPYTGLSENVTSAGLWSTSNPLVATVSNGSGADVLTGNWGTGGGLITAQGRGNCTITFVFGTVSGSLTVSVA